MLLNAKTTPPDRLVFKGKPIDVYIYKLILKDSIWFMWENKCKTGPHAEEKKVAPKKDKEERKHKHRDRANETTLKAKYTFSVTNMVLVSPDKGSDEKSWSFNLASG